MDLLQYGCLPLLFGLISIALRLVEPGGLALLGAWRLDGRDNIMVNKVVKKVGGCGVSGRFFLGEPTILNNIFPRNKS